MSRTVRGIAFALIRPSPFYLFNWSELYYFDAKNLQPTLIFKSYSHVCLFEIKWGKVNEINVGLLQGNSLMLKKNRLLVKYFISRVFGISFHLIAPLGSFVILIMISPMQQTSSSWQKTGCVESYLRKGNFMWEKQKTFICLTICQKVVSVNMYYF